MTKRFWYNVGFSVILFAAVSLLLKVTGHAPSPSPPDTGTQTGLPWLTAFLLTVPVLYLVARLLLRTIGSDRSLDFLGLYAFALFLPLFPALTRSVPDLVAVLLVLTALLDILDCDVTRKAALRSGLCLSFACLLSPGVLFIVILLLPVVALIVGSHWRGMAEFVLGALAPLAVIRAFLGLFGWASGGPPVPIAGPPGDLASWVSTAIENAGVLRGLAETHLLLVYAAFGAAAAVAVTVRGTGLSRRSVLAATWLLLGLSVFVLGGITTKSAEGLLAPLACILLLLTANAGLSVFPSAGTPVAPHRWTAPLGGLFLLPALVSFAQLLF